MTEVRVRFAPSPTGELHIGGARTALFNWLFARKEKGTFVLRIDDTDTERSQEKYWKGILEGLNWLGLDWDEGPEKGGPYGPYFQSQRYDSYIREINKLLGKGKAYRCYCSKEELAKGREEAKKQGKPFIYPGNCRPKDNQKDQLDPNLDISESVIRFKTPDSGETVIHDKIRGTVTFENQHIEDFIILKSDGVPTYNFASVVDDWEMNISHVIRAEEHLTNTSRQKLIAEALSYNVPEYAHVPIILAPDKSKLSKRHGATSVQEFRDEGFLPEALINYLALMGWSPPGEQEILSLDEIVKYFSLERVSKTAAIYDLKKVTWINGHYFRESDPERLADLSIPFLQARGFLPENPTIEDKEMTNKIVKVMHDRAKTLKEFADSVDYFFHENFQYDEKEVSKVLGKEDAGRNIKYLIDKLKDVENFNKENIEKAFQETCQELDISPGRLNKPVRLALSGVTMGPELMDMVQILGKDKTLQRLEEALQKIEELIGQ